MATIKFLIQSRNNPASIYIRFKEGRNIDVKAKTNFVINPTHWSNTKGQPKNLKDEIFKKLNADLVKLKTNLLNHYNDKSFKAYINSAWLKDFINPIEQTEAIPNKLISYFDYYALHKKSSIQPATYKKLFVNKHLLERFEKATKTTYLITDVNADFKLQFEDFCKKENYAAIPLPGQLSLLRRFVIMHKAMALQPTFSLIT